MRPTNLFSFTQTFPIYFLFFCPYFLVLMVSFTFPYNYFAFSYTSTHLSSSLQYAHFFFSLSHFPSSFPLAAPPVCVIFSIPPLLVRSYELRSPPCHGKEEHIQRQSLFQEGGESGRNPTQPLPCAACMCSLLRNSYFFFFPPMVCEEKSVRDASWSSQITGTTRK